MPVYLIKKFSLSFLVVGVEVAALLVSIDTVNVIVIIMIITPVHCVFNIGSMQA